MQINFKEIIIDQQERLKLPTEIVPRANYSELAALCSSPHAVIVKGVRRCGKSTLLSQLLQQLEQPFYYLNFEDERLLRFTVNDFNKLYESFVELHGERNIFYFDEIQNIEQWEIYVRRMQDSGFKFFLTGSNASLLSKEMGTKLTGRHLDIELFPFSFAEFLQHHHMEVTEQTWYETKKRGHLRRLFNHYLRHGGMPEYLRYGPLLEDSRILVQVYEDILFRDVISRYEIKDVKGLRELSLYLITNMARTFSFNKLLKFISLGSINTIKNYIQYLEDCYLLFSINQYTYSLKEQVIAAKKIYAIDNGLANAIAFQFSKNQGQFLENLVFLELARHKKDIYYYKTQKNLEVDFLLRQGNQVESIIQVAFKLENEETRNREIKALVQAMEELHLDNALLLTDDEEGQVLVDKKTITILPVYKWLLKNSP